MHITKIVKTCLISSLKGGEKFILKNSMKDFHAGKKVKVFVRMGEPAYGFFAVSLDTGKFIFEIDHRIAHVE